MENLYKIIKDVFETDVSRDFIKRASYYSSMDYVEYVARDAICVSDRIDQFLTLIWADEELVGFRLKGFRCIFDNVIKEVHELRDSDFLPMIVAIENVLTHLGNEFIGDDTKNAYKLAADLATRDNVQLNDFEHALAA